MKKHYEASKITQYKEFVALVEEVGFMPLSNNPIGFLNLSDLTHEENWHTGLDTDPWSWRVTAEENKVAAYAKVFNKKPGFISLEWYPKFIAARRRGLSFDEMYSEGLLSSYAKQIYDLFQRQDVLAAYEIKALCGIKKETNAKFEAAMGELQMKLFITSNGTKRKINAKGEAYGWPSTAFSTVEAWAGEELIQKANTIAWQQAVEEITERIKAYVPVAQGAKLKGFIGA